MKPILNILIDPPNRLTIENIDLNI